MTESYTTREISCHGNLSKHLLSCPPEECLTKPLRWLINDSVEDLGAYQGSRDTHNKDEGLGSRHTHVVVSIQPDKEVKTRVVKDQRLRNEHAW